MTFGILYNKIAPLHMSQGDRVEYIVARRYSEAGSLPAFCRQSISACSTGLSCWTLRLYPWPAILPSITSTDPIGIPPRSANPALACSIAACRNGSLFVTWMRLDFFHCIMRLLLPEQLPLLRPLPQFRAILNPSRSQPIAVPNSLHARAKPVLIRLGK